MTPGEGGDAAGAVMDTWDRVVALAERIELGDWSRPTPCPDVSVGALVAHVAMVAPPGPDQERGPQRLLDGLRAARRAQAVRLSDETRSRRILRAACLDMWVHAADLATTLGEPLDVDEDSPAVLEACRYLLGLTPHLFKRTGAGEDATLTIAVRGLGEQGMALKVRAGRAVWSPQHDPGGDAVTVTPAAFLLLLSGRGDPEYWRDAGALEWSGAGGEEFVRKARIFG